MQMWIWIIGAIIGVLIIFALLGGWDIGENLLYALVGLLAGAMLVMMVK